MIRLEIGKCHRSIYIQKEHRILVFYYKLILASVRINKIVINTMQIGKCISLCVLLSMYLL